jgi:hypothetical protein
MSNPNTIPEFLGIMLVVIVIMSVVGVIIGTIYEKITHTEPEKISKKEEHYPNKTSLSLKKELMKKPPIETFVRGEIKNSDDYTRYSQGSPGETSRVLSQNYYTFFFNDKKTLESALQMLNHRNSTLIQLGVGLDVKILKELADIFYSEISYLIFAVASYEDNIFNSNTGFFDYAGLQSSYSVIAEEYNKICPYGLEESTDYSFEKHQEIKDVFYKYNKYF